MTASGWTRLIPRKPPRLAVCSPPSMIAEPCPLARQRHGAGDCLKRVGHCQPVQLEVAKVEQVEVCQIPIQHRAVRFQRRPRCRARPPARRERHSGSSRSDRAERRTAPRSPAEPRGAPASGDDARKGMAGGAKIVDGWRLVTFEMPVQQSVHEGRQRERCAMHGRVVHPQLRSHRIEAQRWW